MTVAAVSRKAGPFVNETETASIGPFPFTFKIFALTDVKVQRSKSTDLNGGADTLKYGEDYTVSANLNTQDSNPGGSITLTGTVASNTGTLLQPGYSLAIISDVPYSQLTRFTNYDRFMPDILNTVHDRAVADIQQLVEILDRSVTIPATSTQTPEELVETLQKAAETAEQVAASYASQAQSSATAASASEALAKAWATKVDGKVANTDYSAKYYATYAKNAVDGLESTTATLKSEIQAEGATQKSAVTAEGTTQKSAVTAEGTTQKNAVTAEGTKQIGLVTAEGTTQVAAVEAEGTEQLEAIQDKIDYIETISPNKTDVEKVASNITSVVNVSSHTDDITEIIEHIDEVHTVGQDLQGINADSLDFGSVTENPDTITTVTDGYIKKVAEHIDDCIHPVSLKLSTLEEVLTKYDTLITAAETATTKASEASASATAAASSATKASSYADDASESAKIAARYVASATAKADEASASASEASASATEASASADSASASATAAAGSATTASTKATEAATSADEAETAETNAKAWATQTDSPVEGELYGAKYYAEQAQAATGQVQSDWGVTDTSSLAFILNKPTLGALAAKDTVSTAEIDARAVTAAKLAKVIDLGVMS